MTSRGEFGLRGGAMYKTPPSGRYRCSPLALNAGFVQRAGRAAKQRLGT